jgi:glycosyltransferase involved in cell wall biosynthesis
VAFLLQELNFGGSQTQALELARALDPARFQVRLWTLMAGLDLLPMAKQWGLEVRQLGTAGYVWPPALARLAAALRRQRTDLLLLYTGIPNIWGRLLGRLCKVPVIVATCRGSLEPRRQLDRWLWRLADHHICNAQGLKDQLAREAGVDPGVISVIYNGVDTARFRPASGPEASAAPVVLCLGRMSPEKGQEFLLQAFALTAREHARAQLWLVGQGPRRGHLARLVQAMPCRERIRLLPATSDVPALLRQASILALPSRHEGLPNVVLEAMATGLPVVASNLSGVAELVEPERTGLLAPPGDVTAWAAALARLLGDPALGRSWGRSGRQRVLERFSLEAMVQAHQTLFDRLLARRGG